MTHGCHLLAADNGDQTSIAKRSSDIPDVLELHDATVSKVAKAAHENAATDQRKPASQPQPPKDARAPVTVNNNNSAPSAAANGEGGGALGWATRQQGNQRPSNGATGSGLRLCGGGCGKVAKRAQDDVAAGLPSMLPLMLQLVLLMLLPMLLRYSMRPIGTRSVLHAPTLNAESTCDVTVNTTRGGTMMRYHAKNEQ
mmetsp:Transcript_112632/g.290934  ORF Transcript_112632/g.290934 Transcript_112632/m.290934 type:complete len:198 (+) Transcript_112632:100-693(+)